MATKAKSKKKVVAKKSKGAKKTAATSGGRPSSFSGKSLTKLADKNPRREGTHGFKSFSLIKNGMTYEAYLAAGGRRNDLAYDVARKHVKVA
jgi:hypothetical protein